MPPEHPPVIYLFAGSNGAGKSTFARAFLTSGFDVPPRFLNADEIARGLSPLSPESVALKAGKLLLSEIQECLRESRTFALESTLSGNAQVAILEQAKAQGYRIEIYYLWLPSPALAIKRIAQRVKKGGHHIPSSSVRRRYHRSLRNFVEIYTPLADYWELWENSKEPPSLTVSSKHATITALQELLSR